LFLGSTPSRHATVHNAVCPAVFRHTAVCDCASDTKNFCFLDLFIYLFVW